MRPACSPGSSQEPLGGLAGKVPDFLNTTSAFLVTVSQRRGKGETDTDIKFTLISLFLQFKLTMHGNAPGENYTLNLMPLVQTK